MLQSTSLSIVREIVPQVLGDAAEPEEWGRLSEEKLVVAFPVVSSPVPCLMFAIAEDQNTWPPA